MKGPPLGPGGEDITWPDQVAPRGRKASSTRENKPQTSNLKCPACGKGRHSREDCWVLHPHKAPEWLQDRLKSKKIGKGGQAKPIAQGGGKGKEPDKGGKFPPCKGCGSTLHPPEDCWTLNLELREKAKNEGGSVSETTEKVAGNAGNPRKLTRLVGI